MKAPWIVCAASVLATGGALAAPLGGAYRAHPALEGGPGLMLVQNDFESRDRVMRLMHNRSVIENALRAPRLVDPMTPASRALQAPEPEPVPQAPEIFVEEDYEEESEVVAAQADRMSCEAAAAIVEDYGFSDVQATECSADIYRFSAARDGTAYAIGVTASGEIADVSRQ